MPRRLDDYVVHAGGEAVERLREVARPLRGARLLEVNSTSYGGGVAELLVTHVALFRDLGIEATWAVVDGTDEFFGATKAVHNALQGARVDWTPALETVYWQTVRANAEMLDHEYDVVLVNDPQPAGLLAVVEDEGRRAGSWIWRCHIDLSTTNERVWSFFEPMVNRYDAAVFTLPEYAQPGIDGPQLAFIPPSIDPTADKNRALSESEVADVLARFRVDPARPMAVQVSRFDPWKDPLGVIDAFRGAREEIRGLQLVMVGSMASDDPEGVRYFEGTMKYAGGDPDIHLLTDADGVHHLEVNAFQRAADVVVQKSTREGFGLVVAEAMWKGRPVIGGDVGGIRLQVEDGVSGYLVGSPAECAARLTDLLRDRELGDRMGAAGRQRVRDRFLSLRELEDHLRLFASILG